MREFVPSRIPVGKEYLFENPPPAVPAATVARRGVKPLRTTEELRQAVAFTPEERERIAADNAAARSEFAAAVAAEKDPVRRQHLERAYAQTYGQETPAQSPPPTWEEVLRHPSMQGLDDEQLEAARNQYFLDVVAPLVPTEQLRAAREAFDRDTKPGVFERALRSAKQLVQSLSEPYQPKATGVEGETASSQWGRVQQANARLAGVPREALRLTLTPDDLTAAGTRIATEGTLHLPQAGEPISPAQVEAMMRRAAQELADRGGLLPRGANAAVRGVVSGTNKLIQNTVNFVPLVADTVNRLAVNPILQFTGTRLGPAPRLERGPLEGVTDMMPAPKVAQKRWDDLKEGERALWLGYHLAEQAPQIAGFLTAAFVPRLATAYLMTLGAGSAGQAYDESLREKLDPDRAMATAWTEGALEVLSERLPLEAFAKIHKWVKALPPEKAAGFLGKALRAAGLTVKGATAIGAQAGVESAEEVFAQITQNLSRRYIGGDERVKWDDGVKEAAIIGAAAGGVMGTPHGVAVALAPAERTETKPADQAKKGVKPRVEPVSAEDVLKKGATVPKPDTGAAAAAPHEQPGATVSGAPIPVQAGPGFGPLDVMAHRAATSPRNELPEPTDAQKEAGNYPKGRLRVAGLDISVENPEGSQRSGTDPEGNPWSVTMRAHYGYIRRTEGKDGDQVDVYVKPGTPEDFAGRVFVVNQVDPETGRFDEHKVVLGAENQAEAQALYDAHFSDGSGPKRRGSVVAMPLEAFKRWLKEGDTRRPVEALRAQWDFQTTFPVPAEDSAYYGDLTGEDGEADPARLKAFHDEVRRDLVNTTAAAQAIERSLKDETLTDKRRKQLQEELKRLRSLADGIASEYAMAFGREAAEAFIKPAIQEGEALGRRQRIEAEDLKRGRRKPRTEGGRDAGTVRSDQGQPDQTRGEREEGQGDRGPDLQQDPKTRGAQAHQQAPEERGRPGAARDQAKVAKTGESKPPPKRPGEVPQWAKNLGLPADGGRVRVLKDFDYLRGGEEYTVTFGKDSVYFQRKGGGGTFLKPWQVKQQIKSGNFVRVEPAFGAANKIFTRERADRAREILKRKLGQLNAGLDPEMMQAGIELAGYYIEGGARKFADYAARMVEDLGEAARPYLKAWYLAVRNWPGFDASGMETEAELEAQAAPAKAKGPSEKQRAVRERLKRKAAERKRIDPETDSIIPAAIKLGGITMDARLDITGDTRGNRQVPFVGALFRRDGLSLDDMASQLGALGYLTREELEDVDGGVQALRDKIRDEWDDIRRHWSIQRSEQALARDAGLLEEEPFVPEILEEEGLEATEENLIDAELVARAAAIDEAAVERLAVQHEGDDAAFMRAIEELIDEREQGQEAGAGRDRDRAEASPILESYTLDELKRRQDERDAAERQRAEDERQEDLRAQADRERENFRLTGSDREADQQAAAGQSALFGSATIESGEDRDAQRPPRAQARDDQGDRAARPDRGEDRGPLDAGLAEGDPDARSEGSAPRSPGGASRAGGEPARRGAEGGREQPSRGPRDHGAVRDRPGSSRVNPPTDYAITDADRIGEGGPKAKYRDNIAAIRLLKALEAEGRRASPKEQRVLVRYVGWGGLKGVFDPENREWAREHTELKELLTEEEYERARRSILDAHYTSVPVVRALWRAMERMGFDGGRVLEPAMGVGHFFGLMPGEIRARSTLFGVELDPITGKIARQLYQKADIATPVGFQDVAIPDGYFDVAVGNPPFGNQQLYDRNHPDLSKFSIHNFFFAKSLEKLRPGGLMGMVVSRYFLDAQDAAARTWIAQRAELIGGVRLPNTAFKGNAGTEVVADVLFFQKREKPLSAEEAAREPWVQVEEIELETGDGERQTVPRNRYYSENPQHVLGRESLAGSLYRANEYTVLPEGEGFEPRLAQFVERLPEKRYAPPAKRVEVLVDPDGQVPEDVKVGGYFILPDGAIARRLEDALGKRRFERIEPASEMGAARIKGMVQVRDALRRLMRAELSEDSTEAELATLRRRLNETYDGFVRKYGFINALANRRAFQEDPDLPLLESLEPGYDPGLSREAAKKRGLEPRPPRADKANIFRKRVLQPYSRVAHAESPQDALVASLNERGGVDLAYMSQITGTDPQTLTRELKGLIYENPEGGWESADQYLTGNVKAKLAQAKAAAERDPRFKENVEALEKVQPPDVDALDISVRLGSPWVPADVVEAFAEHLLGGRAVVSFVPAVGRWSFRAPGGSDTARTSTWGTQRMPADQLIEALLNLRKIEVKDNIGTRDEPNYVVNEEETRAAQGKAEDILRAFKDWVWQDPARRERLVRIYNDTYNTHRPRTFDGSHLRLPGMNPAIELRPHQKDAIWRVIQDRTTLLDHVVGAGKTYTIIGALMELRRLGVIRKPILTVPNYLVRQWRDEFYRLYPNANVLAAVEKDFEQANRQRLFARIATGDWDAVIVPHSSFKKIGMPPETEQRILGEMLGDLTGAIEQMKRERGDRNVIRDMERIKERLEQKVKKLKDKSGKKDRVVTFDELGADALAVDEAHLFKNLFYFSSMQNVAGLGNPTGSGRAFDMFVKVRYLQERFAERGVVVFATGTPVSNSLVEMFTMQRYLQYGELKRRNIHLLDSWARVYGDVQQVYEVHPSGNGYRLATRFARFVNLPELMGLYKSFADVITMKDLQAQARKQGKRWPVPKPKSGKPILHVAERSPEQVRFFGEPEFERRDGKIVFKHDALQVLPAEELPKPPQGERKPGLYVATPGKGVMAGPFESPQEAEAERVRLLSEPVVAYNTGSILWKFENLKRLTKETDGKVNALSITNEARKAGLDYRLIDPNAPDFPGSKINLAVDEVVRIHREWSADRGTQLIFCDLSIPNSARSKLARELAQQQAKEDTDSLESAHEEREQEEAPQEEEQKVSVDQLLALQSRHSVYDDVKAKLIAKGIPEKEIAFIHDYDTAEKKAKLFKAMNAGEIRVLMGSTEKMGAGMNVQERLVAIHHLDAPWRPSDLEQRNGRGFRQGNKLYERDPEGFALEEHRYATRQTYDTRMWQIIEHKANGVEQLRHADEAARTIDDIAGEAASAADMKAAASGNPLILEEIKLRNEVQKLEAEEAHYQRVHFELQRKERWLSEAPKRRQAALEELEPWLVTAERHPPMDKEALTIEVGGQRITDRQKLLEPLLSEVKKALARGKGASAEAAGRYRGFYFGFSTPMTGKELYGEWSLDGKSWKVFAVYAEGDDFKPAGLIQRLDNAIGHLPRERDAIEERERQELAELEQVRAELAKPFAKKAELERARREHGEVVRKLQAQGGAIELTPAMRRELAEALRARGIEPRFSRGRASVFGMAAEDVRALVEARTRSWKNRPNIHVLARIEDAPAELRDEIRRQGADEDTAGAFHDGDVYLFAENLQDEAHAEFVLLHEATHRGLRALLGEALDAVLMEIYLANARVRRRAEQLRAADRHLSKVRAVEEALADLGGENLSDSVWVRLVAAFRRFLRRLGFRLRISDTEVRALVARALRYSREPAPTAHLFSASATMVLSRTGEDDAAEFAATERAYGGREAYERERAAGRTKLAYAQWVRVRTPQFKARFGDWELAALEKTLRRVRGSDQVKALRGELVGKPMTNLETGIVATVSGESFAKMLSKSVVERSVSPQAHYQALGNLDTLFRLATKRLTRPGKQAADARSVGAIHHFDVPMPFDGEVLRVKIMAKEFAAPAQGTRLYLVQAVEIENAGVVGQDPGVSGQFRRDEPVASQPPPDVNERFARMVAAVKGEGVSQAVDPDTGEPQVASIRLSRNRSDAALRERRMVERPNRAGLPQYHNREIALWRPVVREEDAETRRIAFDILDMAATARTGKPVTVGQALLSQDKASGNFTELWNIEIRRAERGKGWGEKTVAAILATNEPGAELRIVDITVGEGEEDARPFWRKLGTTFLNYSSDPAVQMDGVLSADRYLAARGARMEADHEEDTQRAAQGAQRRAGAVPPGEGAFAGREAGSESADRQLPVVEPRAEAGRKESLGPRLSRVSRTQDASDQAPGYRARVRRLIGRLDAAMDPLGKLPDKQAYLRKRYETLGVIARVDEIAKKIGQVFGSASEADRQAVYDYLTTRDASPTGIQDETVRAQAVATKRYIESVGDALVARGLLSEEAREAHRGSYLPRVYLKYLLSEADWKALGSGKKPSDMGYLKRRKDIPEEIRRVLLGEITDPGFLSATAVAKPMRDMALLDWLEEISQNQNWVLPKSLVQWQGRTVSAYWLKVEAARLRKQANYQDAETAQKARAAADRMDQVADEALGELASAYQEYKQIPNTARYGRLRGMWVRREIYDDILGIHDLLPQDATWFQSVFGYGGIGTKLTQLWKASKVSLNPPAQVRNFVSNMVLLQLSGVPLRRIPGLLFRVVRQIAEGGQYWQIAKKYGVTESTFSTQELYRIKRDLLDLERRARGWNPIRVIRHAAAVVLDAAGDAYQMMEALGKTMKIMDAMERQGMTEWEAALEAQKWLFDYSLVPQSVRYARNAPIGVPFFTFHYKVLPRLVEVALLHPQRFLPWVGLYYALAYAALAAFDDDDDDFLERAQEAAKALVPGRLKKALGIESTLLDKLKKALPDWLQERGHVAVLPFRDDQGRLQVVDLGYFFPWTLWTEALGQAFGGEFGKLPQTVGLFGGPITDLVTAVKTGLDPFTDRPIIEPGDPPARQAVALVNYLYDMMMPPIVSSRGFVSPSGLVDKQYGGKLIQALTGTTDKYGQPRATLEQAILGTVGVNLYALEPEKTRAQNLRRMAHELEQVRIRLRFRLQDRSLGQAQRQALIDEYRDEMKRRYEEIGRYLEESRVPRRVSGGN
ncbi:MAG: DEAD/DEAH box helicase family protein [Pseudomonadota bacterium]